MSATLKIPQLLHSHSTLHHGAVTNLSSANAREVNFFHAKVVALPLRTALCQSPHKICPCQLQQKQSKFGSAYI
jgi:hypothetical protein